MSTIVRHSDYKMIGDEGRVLRLKKWSTAKLFLLVKDIGAILEEALNGVSLSQISEIQIISKVVISLCRSEQRAARLISESLDPKLKHEEILNWDPEDFLGCLRAVFDLNFTEDLSKNFQGFLGSLGRATKLPTTTGA